MSPLSDYLFQILREIPSDRTFTQNPRFTHTSTKKDHRFWSLDLTAATDRFPVSLQVQILSFMINSKFAEGWKMLMVGSPFAIPSDATDSINYSVGQPMGAKSS